MRASSNDIEPRTLSYQAEMKQTENRFEYWLSVGRNLRISNDKIMAYIEKKLAKERKERERKHQTDAGNLRDDKSDGGYQRSLGIIDDVAPVDSMFSVLCMDIDKTDVDSGSSSEEGKEGEKIAPGMENDIEEDESCDLPRGIKLAGKLRLEDGKVNGIPVKILHETGSTYVVVRMELVKPQQFTGKFVHSKLANGTLWKFPTAEVEMETCYGSGVFKAICMENPVADVLIGRTETDQATSGTTEIGKRFTSTKVEVETTKAEVSHVAAVVCTSDEKLQEKNEINSDASAKLRRDVGCWTCGSGVHNGFSCYPERKICCRCGLTHPPRRCPAWNKVCYYCSKLNHYERVCRSKRLDEKLKSDEVTTRLNDFKDGPSEANKCEMSSRGATVEERRPPNILRNSSRKKYLLTTNEYRHAEAVACVAKETMDSRVCVRCGLTHPPRRCPAWSKVCYCCSKNNHYGRVCRFRNVNWASNEDTTRSRNFEKSLVGKQDHSREIFV